MNPRDDKPEDLHAAQDPDNPDTLAGSDATGQLVVYPYVAKMSYPGRWRQGTWSFNATDDAAAVAFVAAGIAPGGTWEGWSVVRLMRINYPAPPTIIPFP